MPTSVKERSVELLGRVRRRLARERFWILLAGATLLVVVPALLVGRAAAGRAEALEAERARLERREEATASLLRRFEHATEAERRRWRESESRLQAVALESGGQVGVAQQLAMRAEAVGIRRPEIRFEPSDTLDVPVVQVGVHTFSGSPVAISMSFVSGYGEVVDLLGTLPPRVQTRGLRMDREGDAVRARLLLVTYRAAPEGSDASLP